MPLYDDLPAMAKLRALMTPKLMAFRARVPGMRTSMLMSLRFDIQGNRELFESVLSAEALQSMGSGARPPTEAETAAIGAAALAIDAELDLRIPTRKAGR